MTGSEPTVQFNVQFIYQHITTIVPMCLGLHVENVKPIIFNTIKKTIQMNLPESYQDFSLQTLDGIYLAEARVIKPNQTLRFY